MCFFAANNFGLGHGVAEAIMVLLPALSIVPVSQLGLAFSRELWLSYSILT